MPTTIRSIGIRPTFSTLNRTTANITYSSPSSPVVASMRRVSPASRPYAFLFMRAIVVLLLLLTAGLNFSSTARAADGRCLRFGNQKGARALVVARPGVDVRAAVMRGRQDGKGPVVVRPSRTGCRLVFWVSRDGVLTVPGWKGVIRSDSTRIDGLVAAADVADAVGGSDVLRPGGDADVPKLRARLERTHDKRFAARLTLVAILLGLALVAPRRALVAGPAAIGAALLLSALGWTSVVAFAALTLLGSLAPVRTLWLFFGAFLVVLALSPETQALALLGPHPENGGRFYGVTNETETLLLAPALLLGVAAAPLVIVVVAWSRAGADGGGALVFLSSYAWLAAGRVTSNRLLLGIGAAAGLVLVGIDAATGGSSHVTRTIGDGPGAVWDALTHRSSSSWDDATATPARTALNVALLAGLAWLATLAPRRRLLDAFLVGIAVSLVVNDTPHDVLLWGSLQALAVRRAG